MTKTNDQQTTATGDIHKRIIAIMREIPAVPKDSKNAQQGYFFRGIDQVYNMVHSIMARHGVFMRCEVLSDSQSERPAKSGGVIITEAARLRYHFVADDGSSISTEVLAYGMDSGDKAANKAMSAGQKYAILQTLLVPTDEPKDPENDNPEPAPQAKPSDDFIDTPADPGKFHLLEKFAAAKKQLGADLYYEVLSRYKFNHATDVEPEERQAVIDEMRQAYKSRAPKRQREPGDDETRAKKSNPHRRRRTSGIRTPPGRLSPA